MNKTAIEWCDYTVNPVKGLCPVGCEYCYARRMYKRFHWDETIRPDLDWSVPITKLKKPSRVFIGSTMELFGPWVDGGFLESIIRHVGAWYPQHTFIFLTKRPWELKRYNPWPTNCWVGMSATNGSQIGDLQLMGDVQAKVKFVSFEPLLDYSAPDLRWVNWVILGQQTPVKKPIPPSWIADIETAANRVGIPVFHKDNLGMRATTKRQEWPK